MSHRSKNRLNHPSRIYDSNFDKKRNYINQLQRNRERKLDQHFESVDGGQDGGMGLNSSLNSQDSEFKRNLRIAKEVGNTEQTITVPAIKLMSKIQSVQNLSNEHANSF